ncbi:MAG: beta-galactosidase [Tannerella sp.]|jgi:hypothetical protein|nr:beta-galactosidase [Tannerella sp.]
MKKRVYIWVFIPVWFLFFPARGMSQEACPFGFTAHIQSGEEHDRMPKNLQMMRDAGARWVRTDFSWGGVESPQGNWHFEHLDRVVEETGKQGIQVLALLLYNVAWANPAYQHLDAWLTYVEKTVMRYKDKVRYWEIWNEPNLFWDKMGGNAAEYAVLLEATYKKIKEIDPDLVVLHAGLCGIPMEYAEKVFETGAGKYFDRFCIHPYRPLLQTMEETVRYHDDLAGLRTLMAKYKVDKKSIWITEMGYTSMVRINVADRDAFHEAKSRSGKAWRVAVVSDDDFPVDPAFAEQTVRSFFPEGTSLEFITFFELKRMSRNSYDAVFFPPSENLPLHISQLIAQPLVHYLGSGGRVYYYTKEGKMYYYDDMVAKERSQAVFLGQTMLLSLRFGIERYICYEFSSPERNIFDREDNFGVVRRELEPKPAYYAYATVGKLFSEGSVMDMSVDWNRKDFCVVSWTQQNGTRVWAIWSPEGVRRVNVKIGKGLQQTLNGLGEVISTVTAASETLEINAEITYLVGPATLDIQ